MAFEIGVNSVAIFAESAPDLVIGVQAPLAAISFAVQAVLVELLAVITPLLGVSSKPHQANFATVAIRLRYVTAGSPGSRLLLEQALVGLLEAEIVICWVAEPAPTQIALLHICLLADLTLPLWALDCRECSSLLTGKALAIFTFRREIVLQRLRFCLIYRLESTEVIRKLIYSQESIDYFILGNSKIGLVLKFGELTSGGLVAGIKRRLNESLYIAMVAQVDALHPAVVVHGSSIDM